MPSIMTTVALKDIPMAELEKLLELYPWYAAARKELFLRKAAMGEEYRRDALRRAVLYIYPDYGAFSEGYVLSSAADTAVFWEGAGDAEPACGPDLSEENRTRSVPVPEDSGTEAEVEKMGSEERPRVYVVGGDYFMPEDLRKVQRNDLLVPDVPSGSRTVSSALDGWDGSVFTDEAFYTETLARIYADQELYDRANEVYEKLILLYPEKSAYFAALKNDIKKYL